jgi:hypothetical protein
MDLLHKPMKNMDIEDERNIALFLKGIEHKSK